MFFPHFSSSMQTIIVFAMMVIIGIFISFLTHHHDKPISLESAVIWLLFWVLMAMAFAIFLYVYLSGEIAILFLTSYALETVLSIDNLFVIMSIFAWFKIPDKYRYRVLYWGVLGAVVFRGIFVMIGTSLLRLGAYVEVLFALIISWTAVTLLQRNKEESDEIEDYSNHLAYRLIKRFYPIWPKVSSHKFVFTKQEIEGELKKPENQEVSLFYSKERKYYATPLLLCAVVVELSDLMFSFDSVFAIIAITRDPLIIYSAMVFTILSLRTLYFVLEWLKQCLVHLEKAILFLLFFVAFKLCLNATDHFWHHGYDISTITSLLVVLGMFVLGVISSIIFPGKKSK